MDGAPHLSLYQFSEYSNNEIDLSVASINPHCLAVHTYMKLCGVPFTPVNINDDACSPGGKGLPVLGVNHGKTYTGALNIINFLSDMKYVLPGDEILSETQRADQIAFISIVDEKLYKYQLYNWWVETENYERFTHGIYSWHMKFPRNWWQPKQLRKKVISMFDMLGWRKENSEEVYKESEFFYKTLATKLGDKDYFFGSLPTTLDCFVFGFLMTQMVPRIPTAPLLEKICAHKNLLAFCEKIATQYFSSDNSSTNNIAGGVCNFLPLQEFTDREQEKKRKKNKEKSQNSHLEWYSTLCIIGSLATLLIFGSFKNLAIQTTLSRLSARGDDHVGGEGVFQPEPKLLQNSKRSDT